MHARVFSVLTFVLGGVGGIVIALLLLGRSLPAMAQDEEAVVEEPCTQWQLAMFSVNFPDLIRLDGLSPQSLRSSSVVLPEGWEPIIVQGDFAAVIPAKRCVR